MKKYLRIMMVMCMVVLMICLPGCAMAEGNHAAQTAHIDLTPIINAAIALIAAIILFAVIDFNRIFTWLHQLLFTNDLWLLNPHTDLLIALMPEGMFMHLSQRVLYRTVPMLLFLFAAAILTQKYAQPRH